MRVKYTTKTELGVENWSLEYFNDNKMQYYPGVGKSYPLRTICTLCLSGRAMCSASVTKHNNDEADLLQAIKLVTEKVLLHCSKEFKTAIWKAVFTHMANNNVVEIPWKIK